MSFLKLYVLEISEYYNNGLRIDNLDYWLLVKFGIFIMIGILIV